MELGPAMVVEVVDVVVVVEVVDVVVMEEDGQHMDVSLAAQQQT